MHLTSSPIDWYAARGAGIVAYVLLTFGVLLGLGMSTRRRFERWPRFALEDVHRFVGLLVGTFLAIHIVTIAIDSYLPFSLSSLVVPFTSRYRPAWVGFGIVAAELLAALAIANRMRNRGLSYRNWRRTHYLMFAVWLGATAHGLGSGTDRSAPWLVALWVAGIATVTAATTWRVLRARGVTGPALRAAPLGAGGVLAAVAVVAVVGPLRFHPKPWDAGTFSDALQGQIVRRLGPSRGIVSLAGTGDGAQRVLVRADLLITPQRLESTSFQMEYLPSGTECRGHVTQIDQDGLGLQASCRTPDGRARTVSARWDAGGEGDQSLSGTLASSPA